MRNFFQATKTIYGPSSNGHTTFRSQDGTLLKCDTAVQQRWKEHFEQLLNRVSMVTDDTILSIPKHTERASLDIPPTGKRSSLPQYKYKHNKACGPDDIPADFLKFGGEKLANGLYELISRIWHDKEIPPDLRNANIVTIYKTGDNSDCGNYRGIALLSTAGKKLARVLLNRLLLLTEEILPETQCDFRPSRGTTDMIFVVRQIQKNKTRNYAWLSCMT